MFGLWSDTDDVQCKGLQAMIYFKYLYSILKVGMKYRYSIMTVILNRICIYLRDVQRITGKSEKSGRRLLKKIREQLGKEEYRFITTEEFASYTGIASELIHQFRKALGYHELVITAMKNNLSYLMCKNDTIDLAGNIQLIIFVSK